MDFILMAKELFGKKKNKVMENTDLIIKTIGLYFL